MYLKSLAIQGFKSFPDKILIEFGNDITAIVGPNGSGKSNLSDAILWVMGEQSTKTLRGAKMEDVIFGGTQKRPPLGFAEATLTLDNTDRALPYDSDDVMVTRRYYRSGDSEFYINKQSARLRDIHELFMDTGLGREGYSNISQGRIDEILSLKSTDRREVFEEAAGISKYRHRKEETQRKLVGTEENLLRIGDKISELELQLDPLRAQAEQAKKYLAYRDELRGLEVTAWLDRLDKITDAAQKAEEDYTSASFVLEQEHSALDELYQKSEEMGAQLRAQDEAIEALRSDTAGLEAADQQLDGQIAVLKSNTQNNEENLARVQTELQQHEDRSGGIEQQVRQGRCRIAEIEAQLEIQQLRLQETQAQAQQVAADAEGIGKQYLELREKQAAYLSDLAGARAELSALEESARQGRARVETLESDVNAGVSRRSQAQTALDACRMELAAAQRQVQASQNTVAGYRLRQESRAQRRDQAQGGLQEITAQLNAVSAKIKIYQAMERDYESYQRSVRSVMQESRRGGLEHIHGPVSQLIHTEDRYTTGIEVALGAALQHIVVQTEQDAKAAIGYLKRTNGGRATFLPIHAIEPRKLQETGLEQCRGFVGIAAELVQCQAPYRKIVENLLGRVVLAEQLDSAIAMAGRYGNRFKIVTLDGQVINPGGSMTGGSVAKEAGILSRANELRRLLQTSQQLQEKKEKAESSLAEAQRACEQTDFEFTTANEQLRAAQDQVLQLEGEEKRCAAVLQALEEAANATERELEALRNRLDMDQGRIAAQKTSVESLQRQQMEAERALEALDRNQSDTTRQTQALADQVSALRTELAALAAEKRSALDGVENLEALFRTMEGDRSQKRALAEHYTAAIAKLQAEIDGVQVQKENNIQILQQKQQTLREAQTQRAELESRKTRLERDAQEKNKGLLTMERACALLEQKKLAASMEERQVIDKLWDSYGLTPGTAGAERVELESVAAAGRRIAELKRKLSALGTPNLGAVEEYARVQERYTYLSGQRDDVLTAKRELEQIVRDITAEMTTIFVVEFQKIDGYFGQTFAEMFGGGKGALVLEDPENPLTSGIEIRVQPPGKQLKTITLLSGGEKAFVAIALYFAILKVRPTPFCMLDEIDAALDDRNVERFASYLHGLCQKTQFIVITHRRGTMEASDMLYGVTMQEQGVSKILRMNLNQMEQQLGIVE